MTSPDSFMFDLPLHLPNQVTPPTSTQPQETNPSQDDTSSKQPQQEEEQEINEEESVGISAKSNEPICIPGTKITLQTEEDIAKWIEERKKNWPSKKNITRKQEQQEEQAQNQKEQAEKQKTEPEGNSRKRPVPSQGQEGTGDKKSKNICRFFQRYGKCKFGNRCKNVHEIVNEVNPIATSHEHDLTHYKRNINGIPVLIPKLYANRTKNTAVSSSSLFKHLVAQDQLLNENNEIIDFIKYLDEQGLIDHNIMKK